MDLQRSNAAQRAKRDGAAIEQWMIMRVAALAEVNLSEIDVTLPFSHYALDSAKTAELTADLEDWLDIDLPPTLIWDYPTITALARHLAAAGDRP